MFNLYKLSKQIIIKHMPNIFVKKGDIVQIHYLHVI